MITISEEVVLLLLDYDSGVMNRRIPEHSSAIAVSGGLLMDLSLENRIDTDPETLSVKDRTPLGEPFLDDALSRIAADNGIRTIDYWLDAFAADPEPATRQLVSRLVSRGILLRGPCERLWVMGDSRSGPGSREPMRDVRKRIAGILLSGELPDPRDAMIISLADACHLWNGLVDAENHDFLAPRIRQVARMDFTGQALVESMRHLEEVAETVH